MENYLIATAVVAGLYALMALGLNLIWGVAGMVNLGLVGFYAIGAYATALLTTGAGWPIWAGCVAATAAGALGGAGVALLTSRLRGDYLAIVTLGFAEVVRLMASNEVAWTRGTDGISGVPGPWRGAVSPLGFNLISLGLVWAAVAVVSVLLARMAAAPWGRVLRAVREDEMVAAVAGHPVLWRKVQAFAVGAGVLGLAGGLYAHFNAYVVPDAFGPLVTITIVLALTVGGTGRMSGAVLGAVTVTVLAEGVRFMGDAVTWLRPAQVAAVQQGLVGLVLLLVLHARPGGLLPERVRTYREQ